MKTFETIILCGCTLGMIEEKGHKGWQPVYIYCDENPEGWSWDITFQRETDTYHAPPGINVALINIRAAKMALRSEFGITKQGSVGRHLRSAITELECLMKEELE